MNPKTLGYLTLKQMELQPTIAHVLAQGLWIGDAGLSSDPIVRGLSM